MKSILFYLPIKFGVMEELHFLLSLNDVIKGCSHRNKFSLKNRINSLYGAISKQWVTQQKDNNVTNSSE